MTEPNSPNPLAMRAAEYSGARLLKSCKFLNGFSDSRRIMHKVSCFSLWIPLFQIIFCAKIINKWSYFTSVVWWSKFLATDPEIPGSIPGATRSSEK
jgi:hypothetical protein